MIKSGREEGYSKLSYSDEPYGDQETRPDRLADTREKWDSWKVIAHCNYNGVFSDL